MYTKNGRLATASDLRNKIKKSSIKCTITKQGPGSYNPVEDENLPNKRKLSQS